MVVRTWLPLRYRTGAHYRVRHLMTLKEVVPFGKTIQNVVSGLKERVYYLDDRGTLKPTCSRSCDDLSSLANEVISAVGVCSRLTGSAFVDSRSGSKRVLYANARRQLLDEPRTLGQLAQLGFFTKYENTVWDKQQVPRIISPRDPRFNYLLGRYTVAVEHKIFDALRSVVGSSTAVIAKGLTQEGKAQLIVDKLRAGWVCIGLDASRFDQTIGRTLLRFEHSIYAGIFAGDRLLPSLLRCQLSNYGVARCFDGTVKANIGAMRCSGDQNTSLGNCIISVCLAELFCREHGIVEHDILCDGDDLLLFVPSQSLHLLSPLSDWYLKWGLRMKIEEPASEPERVEFCQSRPVYGPNGWVLVRNPAKALSTDLAGGMKLANETSFLEHMRSVGLCGLSMAAGIPILQEYYEWAVVHGKTGKFDFRELGGVGWQYRLQVAAGHSPRCLPVTPETRLSFERAFGIAPHTQLDLEETIRSMSLSRQSDPHILPTPFEPNFK